jgi:hypothetical protein
VAIEGVAFFQLDSLLLGNSQTGTSQALQQQKQKG